LSLYSAAGTAVSNLSLYGQAVTTVSCHFIEKQDCSFWLHLLQRQSLQFLICHFIERQALKFLTSLNEEAVTTDS